MSSQFLDLPAGIPTYVVAAVLLVVAVKLFRHSAVSVVARNTYSYQLWLVSPA